MPVAFLRENERFGFAPVARPRFLLGRDLDCDLVDASPGVADHHATVRYRRGEFLLKAEDDLSLWVRGERVPFLTLRDGDVVRLAPDAPDWRFRSRVDDAFWPPETQVGEAWLSHPGYSRPEHGPRRFGDGPPVGGRDPLRCRLVFTPTGPWIVKHPAPIAHPLEANEHLRLLAALGGAPHPSLAPVVDGGVTPHDGAPWRWIATRFVEGTCARQLVETSDVEPGRVLHVLATLAEALAHLHHRGLVHRLVAPENVVVAPDDRGVLIDLAHAWSAEHEVSLPSEIPANPGGYVAPEVAHGGPAALAPAVDVYGWAATGFALLTGRSPRRNIRPQGVLARVREEQPERWRLEDEVVEGFLALLVRGLASDPTGRPEAATCSRILDELGARVGRPGEGVAAPE